MEKKQKTEWGYIEWIHMADDSADKGVMSVGLVTMLPHTHAKRHIHYGQEQMLYVLEGNGTYLINDEEVRFSPGQFFVMETDVSHETINDSDGIIRELLVSVPMGKAKVQGGHTDMTFDENVDVSEMALFYKAAGELASSLKQISDLPYTVFDPDGEAVMQSDSYPSYCMDHCQPKTDPSGCECFRKAVGECDSDERWISCECSHGLKTFLCPISFEGKLAGIVRGGHFFTSEKGAKNEENEYDVPITAQIAIHSVLDQIVETIENYLRYLSSIEDLRKKEERLIDTAKANETLKADLTEVEEQVTNLKINHHFLFNTLNCMSAMSLDGDRMDLYQSIIDLSKMFRYTMTAEVKMMSLASEIEYLKSYLNLQKLRYKDGLEITYDIDESCLQTMIPFNFLQPIVENAFTHGFMSYDYKKYLDIKVAEDNGSVRIDMFNNGITPAEAELNVIDNNFRSKNGHGLALIYEKLESCFGEDFDMRISAPGAKGTLVTVILPMRRRPE